jgi:penicillin-binding protein 1C
MKDTSGRRIGGMPALLLAMLMPVAALAVPRFEEVKRQWQPSDTVVLDRHGAALGSVRTDAHGRRLPWVPLAELSPALRRAVLLSEDRRFHAHAGVDWQALAAGGVNALTGRGGRGASTLTMQLAGLIDDDLARRPGGRSLAQKVDQAWTALQLERRWSKDQILEAYLNRVPLRGELVGVHAGASLLFGKAPHGLDARESALVAALLRAPNAKPALVARRACALLRAQSLAGECQGLEGFALQALTPHAMPLAQAGTPIAPHVARLLAAAPGKPVPRSTLDAGIQRQAVDSLRRHLAALAARNVEDGAVLVLDNASGEVLAWVGSSGSLSASPQVDFVTARRQAGSTLKPFLYAQAFAERRLTAASVIDDAPVQLTTAAGLYVPQNYDRHFRGPVSVRTALASSLNVPAVKTLAMVTPENFFQSLRGFGFALRESGDYFGYSLALGSAEVSLLELANAYRALARGGLWSPVRLRLGERAAAPVRAADAAAAFVVADILSDRSARAATFGLDNALATRIWTAVKTGTSKDMRDNWCIGFSSRYTVGVWVGNASGAAMWDVTGITGAAPVWMEVMHALHRRLPSQPPAAPPGVVQQSIRYAGPGAAEAARDEWFLAGTERGRIALAAQPARAGIAAPRPDSIIAFDPDIPPANQRITLRAVGVPMPSWRIDGKPVGRGRALDWMPVPGRHAIALHRGDGTLVERIEIEVRGAAWRRRTS